MYFNVTYNRFVVIKELNCVIEVQIKQKFSLKQ